MTPGRRRRLISWATAVSGAVVLVLTAIWWWRSPEPTSDLFGDAVGESGELPTDLVPVVGNVGWESLPPEEQRRARTPMSRSARQWLARNREPVVSVARAFDVSPIALGGIVAAEETLLVGRIDAIGESLFQAVFGTIRERDLERWVADQERAYQRDVGAGLEPERDRVRAPYLWTLGPAQVSFRLALRIEPQVAATMGRSRRDVKEVLSALTTVSGSLEYAAALLAQSRRAYARIAGLEIGDNPGVMATLYHLGAPTVRARRLAARESGSVPVEMPQVNFYGAWVNLHAEEIARLLEVPPPGGGR
ncbi:MAG TPA: DUF1402 family protein [Gemmatimonadota bacterium]|nr:DUF1402 family protein [Gemmatimonadota bacterium]